MTESCQLQQVASTAPLHSSHVHEDANSKSGALCQTLGYVISNMPELLKLGGWKKDANQCSGNLGIIPSDS